MKTDVFDDRLRRKQTPAFIQRRLSMSRLPSHQLTGYDRLVTFCPDAQLILWTQPMPIFHSIRWRLVASFIVLTLLIVTALGVLVLSAMQRYVVAQETGYLSQNAAALAAQSVTILDGSVILPSQLETLAQTASLLGNFRVKFLDAAEQTVVDSGPPLAGSFIAVAAVQPSVDSVAPLTLPVPALAAPALAGVTVIAGEDGQAIPLGVDVVRVSREVVGPWGPVLQFQEEVTAVATVPLTSSYIAIDTQPYTMAVPAGDRFWTDITAGPVDHLFTVMSPIQAGQQVVGYVELTSAPGIASQALVALRQLFMGAAAIVALVAVGAGLIVSRTLTAPLHALTLATGRMNDGDLTARAPVQGNDEIGALAGAFNRMATALETSFGALAAERDALRHFVADASHELRTPITALRTFNELLQGRAAHDPVAQVDFLAESGIQIRRLERITENLLNLSRLEGGLVELALETVGVAELVEGVVALLRPLAAERHVAVVIEPIDPTLRLRCDPQQLDRALSNLIENGLKFTPAGGRVQIGAATGPTGVQIWVEDNGIGIAAEEQAYIFRRFYRGQNATNGGSGLGLAIVQRIVEAHGGGLRVTSEEGKGSRFVLTFQ